MKKIVDYVLKNYRLFYQTDENVNWGNSNDEGINIEQHVTGSFFENRQDVDPEKVVWKEWKGRKIPFCFDFDDKKEIITRTDNQVSINYDIIASSFYSGETGCSYGCHGFGDCVLVCSFDALHLDPVSGLPVVDDQKCTSCGACVKACPRQLFELRKRWKGDKKIYVACMNEDKGGVARKSCAVACIGCSKCFKVCPHEAITMKNNLAFIDSDKCKLCRKCIPECPTASILEIGFPTRKSKSDEQTVESSMNT